MNVPSAAASVTEILADKAAALGAGDIPAAVRARAEALLIDVVGLCVAARNTDYVKALVAASDPGGGSAQVQAQLAVQAPSVGY